MADLSPLVALAIGASAFLVTYWLAYGQPYLRRKARDYFPKWLKEGLTVDNVMGGLIGGCVLAAFVLVGTYAVGALTTGLLLLVAAVVGIFVLAGTFYATLRQLASARRAERSGKEVAEALGEITGLLRTWLSNAREAPEGKKPGGRKEDTQGDSRRGRAKP